MTTTSPDHHPTPDETTPKNTFSTLFGPPPLIDGESKEAYEAFAAQLRAAVAPADAIEEMLLRDIVDPFWEVQRLRRLKGKYLQVVVRDGLKPVLDPFFDYQPLRELIEAWARRDPDALKTVGSVLQEAGLDMEHVTALAMMKHLKDFDGIDRQTAVAENCRNQALRELERHRESLARRLQSVAQVIDAEFREVEPALDAPK